MGHIRRAYGRRRPLVGTAGTLEAAPRIWLRVAFAAVALPLALWIVHDAAEGAAIRRAAFARVNPIANESLAWKALIEKLSGSLYRGASEVRAGVLRDLERADGHRAAARSKTLVFVVWSLAFLAAAALLEAPRRPPGQADLLLVAACCLIPGLFAPMLTMSSPVELPVVGPVVLNYESKSISGVVTRLLGLGLWLPALLVGLFSVGIPAVKMATMTWEELAASHPPPAALRRFVHHAGRWSMTDVFVVAVVVAFLAGRAAGPEATTIGIGLYFFAGYAVLSQWAAERGRRDDGGQGPARSGPPADTPDGPG